MQGLRTLLATSLLLLGLLPASHAQAPDPLEAVFGVERGLPFSLRLDGQPVARLATQPVRVTAVAPGQHWVELSLPSARRGPQVAVRAQVWLEPGLSTTYMLTERPGYGWRLRQVSTVVLEGYGYEDQGPTYSQPPMATAPAPGGYGYPAPGSYPNQPAPGGYPGPPTSGGYGYPAPGTYPPAPTPGGYPSQPGAPYPGSAQPGGYSGPPVALIPMSPAESADLVRALRACSFDNRRLPLAEQALSRSYLQSEQLADIVRTMAFSDSQQQVAKLGYAHLSDPHNFHRVLSAFTFPTAASQVLDDLGLPRY